MEERTAEGMRGQERERRCLRPDRRPLRDDDDDESGPKRMWERPDHGGVHMLFTVTATRATAAEKEGRAMATGTRKRLQA